MSRACGPCGGINVIGGEMLGHKVPQPGPLPSENILKDKKNTSMILSAIGYTISVGFPTIATYKALKTNDIASMRPWLMYWTVLSLGTAGENLLANLLNYIPFYSFFRVIGVVWLVSVGGVQIWTDQIEPWIANHESEIDSSIRRIIRKEDSQDTVYSQFRLPVSTDSVMSAVASAWRAPKTTEQVQQQRNFLQQLMQSLDSEDFVAVEASEAAPSQEPAARRRWFW